MCQFMLSINNFESTYVLFTFLAQRLFLFADYEFFAREIVVTLRNTGLDIVDLSCNTEYSIRQLELNISESN